MLVILVFLDRFGPFFRDSNRRELRFIFTSFSTKLDYLTQTILETEFQSFRFVTLVYNRNFNLYTCAFSGDLRHGLYVAFQRDQDTATHARNRSRGVTVFFIVPGWGPGPGNPAWFAK